MAKYPVCDGLIIPISGSPRSPFDCVQSDGVTQLAWRFVDVPTPTPAPPSTGNMVYCAGPVIPAVDTAAGADLSGIGKCETGWISVPYSAEGGNFATELKSLNDFNPVQVASIITFCMVIFIIGFSVGVVIRNMRRI